MDTFDSVVLAYQQRARQSITYRMISDPHFEAYFESVGKLRRYGSEHGLDDEWQAVVSSLSRYRYDASHVPLPFNHPYLVSRLNVHEIEYTVSRARVTRPSIAGTARTALDRLQDLIHTERNPFLDGILESHQEPEQSSAAIVLPHSRFNIVLRDFLRREGICGYDVVDPNALRRLSFWDRMIFIGSVRDFDDYVFSSPRTQRTELIGYRWQQGRWEQSESFLGGVLGRSSVRQRFTGSTNAQAGMLSSVDVDAIDHTLRTSTDTNLDEESSASTKVEARLHELFGGKAVLLEASDRRTNMVIDLDADHEERVRQVADSDVEEGMFIVLRTGERGGYLIPIADQIIGTRAIEHRSILKAWKDELRKLENKYGPQGLVNRLLRAGSARATYQNIRNWMSTQSIAPDAAEDYNAIAKLCGMEHDFPAMQAAAKEIRRAHVLAGQKVRWRLLELVQASDIEAIEREGMKQFELPEFEGARLTAYRIEGRSGKTTAVSATSIERVFDLDLFTR